LDRRTPPQGASLSLRLSPKPRPLINRGAAFSLHVGSLSLSPPVRGSMSHTGRCTDQCRASDNLPPAPPPLPAALPPARSVPLGRPADTGRRGGNGGRQCGPPDGGRSRGFKSFGSAERFCRGYGEFRNFLRPCTPHNQNVPATVACFTSVVLPLRSQSSVPHIRNCYTARAIRFGASADRIS
jgi:hypothetical protein